MTSLKNLQKEVQSRIQNDPAHDYSHILRVYKNAQKIAKHEKANSKLVLAAVLLHDIIQFPKSDPRNKTASEKSAILAKKILQKHDFEESEIAIICDAIRDHSYSRGKTPQTIEGKILQDADRLDALGAIGIARTFSVGGSEKRPIYNESDPFCRIRKPDDNSWTVDHFYRKLLLLEKKMNTNTGKALAKKRTKLMMNFLSDLKQEI
ncbi:MAG: HD domain-containing protein [Nitrososphaeria archaeon]|nr:HD domain-containing protein [Nitrososphaeria archaeon]NDB50978.1 HD domain-containing protein [Nitrosopumilaceae archaeon]NDB87332.1 HD domain-containing protein [Nitrososphaerota archaeon]NDB45860.1 HD domain-containing protein [Nitrososphaeria archaeon]NDB89230.1 HD domain-containing protein [Nitrososphaerota archaeon]